MMNVRVWKDGRGKAVRFDTRAPLVHSGRAAEGGRRFRRRTAAHGADAPPGEAINAGFWTVDAEESI
jgi:hypothetical protein